MRIITAIDLDQVTGGAGEGRYCRDGMKNHYRVTGEGSGTTPVGIKIRGRVTYEHTECK